ncbi:MAG TPA: glycosyltransferase family 39 protein [Candidatus Acidoferrales bacterium]|nr:glycosyltransferase family 39 protein [Candidatus Acidoferrales bacterium]
MSNGNRELRRKLFWMVLLALALRLVAMAYVYPMELDPARDHWAFGYETGRIARSIANGHGFGSPLFSDTGPTAWLTPVYPYILAGIFKLFGVYSTASGFIIFTMNALISAFTCLPVFFFTRKSFNARAGLWAGWIWAIFPYEIYWSAQHIWDTWLATLLLAILFCMVLRLAESNRIRDWFGFGVLSGIAALTDPIVLSALPILALWALWRLHKTNQRSLKPAIGAVLAVILVVSPWFIRNDRVFHQFIPFRDVFPLALRVGNIGDTRHMLTPQAGPWRNPAEWNEYLKYGEIAYMAEKGRAARAYISAHRAEYVYNCVRRVVYLWTGFWYLDPRSLLGFPPEPADIFLFTGLTILALVGLCDAFRNEAATAAPYALVLIFFPVAYYITSVEPWYRVPMDPIFISLAAFAITSRLAPAVGARGAEVFATGNSDASEAQERRIPIESETDAAPVHLN